MARSYSVITDLITTLRDRGLDAETVRTGGNCHAVEVRQPGRHHPHVLITDADASVPADGEQVTVAVYADADDDGTVIAGVPDLTADDVRLLAHKIFDYVGPQG